jgi:hypothetical protein
MITNSSGRPWQKSMAALASLACATSCTSGIEDNKAFKPSRNGPGLTTSKTIMNFHPFVYGLTYIADITIHISSPDNNGKNTIID